MSAVSARPLVVGILNCTPDSFYDGGRHGDPIEAGLRLVEEGADWVDVGGESTRPGSEPVPVEEEWARVRGAVSALASRVVVSIDTTKPEVARRAREEGATVLNDVSGLDDPEMAALSGEFEATVVMHMRGTPATMRGLTRYEDVTAEVRTHLVARAARARSPRVYVDPGIGFAKTAEQSLLVLRRLDALVDTGIPVIVGASRKSFIGAALGLSDPSDRLFGSLGAAAWAYHRGVAALRVHDVRATREMLDLMAAIAAAPEIGP